MDKISEYQNKPVIELHKSENCSDQWPFRFGIAKAQLIVDNFEAIKAFVASNGKSNSVKAEKNS